MAKEIIITLPPPDPKLHAHAKGGWRAKAEPTRRLRRAACMAASMAADGVAWPRATVEYRFYFRDARRRDEANAIQSMKPAIDGVVDAGVIAGDDYERLHTVAVRCGIDRDEPRTELVFREWKKLE